jgi:hypothetical protein
MPSGPAPDEPRGKKRARAEDSCRFKRNVCASFRLVLAVMPDERKCKLELEGS